MNIFKKSILSLVIYIFSFAPIVGGETPNVLFTKEMIFEVCDYLVQQNSIYEIDTEIISTIRILAMQRSVFNCISIAYGCLRLKTGLFSDNKFGSKTILDLMRLLVRGRYIVIDFTIFKKAEHLVFNTKNISRTIKQKKKLNEKKLYQSLWLTINKIIPLLTSQLRSRDYSICSDLAELSELIRQNLLYQMLLSETTNKRQLLFRK